MGSGRVRKNRFYSGHSTGRKNTVAHSFYSGLVQMITGRIPADVAGPVGIVSILGMLPGWGFAEILTFTAVLSLNLGIINLFPIPVSDGSRLIFLGIEGLRGKPVAPEKENLIHLIGLPC